MRIPSINFYINSSKNQDTANLERMQRMLKGRDRMLWTWLKDPLQDNYTHRKLLPLLLKLLPSETF